MGACIFGLGVAAFAAGLGAGRLGDWWVGRQLLAGGTLLMLSALAWAG